MAIDKDIKQICSKLLCMCNFNIYATTSISGATYKLPYRGRPEAYIKIPIDCPVNEITSLLLHEAIEAYFHLTQKVSQPLYVAAQYTDRRDFHFDHIEFSEAMADVGDFVTDVLPLLIKEKKNYDKDKRKRKRKRP